MQHVEGEQRGTHAPEGSDQTWEEIGFAEFPIVTTSLKRPPFDTLKFVEEIGTDEQGNPINRTWNMVGSREYGLPRLPDLDVYMAILKLVEQSKYRERSINCTIKDICDIAGLAAGGATYDRVKGAFARYATTTYVAERVFRDQKTKVLIPFESWEIISESRFTENPAALPSFFEVGKKFLTKLQSGQLKPVDLSLWRELPLGLEKPIYHYLDKNFYGGKNRHEIGLKKLSERIALTGHYRPYDLQRLLRKPLTNLVAISFLSRFSFEPSKSFQDPVKLVVVPGPRARGKGQHPRTAISRPFSSYRVDPSNVARNSTLPAVTSVSIEAQLQKDRYQAWLRAQGQAAWEALAPELRETMIAEARAELMSNTKGKGGTFFTEDWQWRMAELNARRQLVKHLPNFEEWVQKGLDRSRAA